MKKKKNILIIILSVIVLIIIGVVLFFILNDKNKLTVQERAWMDNNVSTIQNINIINNANIFGKNAEGVFYDFLKDFSVDYSMQINPITFTEGTKEGLTFTLKNEINDNDVVFYTDHYVLLSKNDTNINSYSDLNSKVIGINSINYNYVHPYLPSVTLNSYENDEVLFASLDTETEYAIVPMLQYLDTILTNNYYINYHLSDIKSYYVMQSANDTLSIVLNKYYQKWQRNLNEYFNNHEFELFVDNLKLTEAEIDKLQSVVHNYGFVNTSPYEVIMGGEYGGIVAVYLSHFSDFSNIDFKFVKYKDKNQFNNAINNNDIEMYFNYYNTQNNSKAVKGPNISYVIASLKDNNEVINSVNSLINKNVYVENNSKLHDYLKTINGVNIIPYEKLKEVKKNKDNNYLLIDKNIYDYNKDSILSKYDSRYVGNINNNYEFRINNNDVLAKLFGSYVKTLDAKEMEILGLENHYDTVKAGSIMSKIATYIICLLCIIMVITLIVIKKSKKIKIARRIKKDDKLKFIDQLTSLKNRNYLSENISVWNNNTIYPQAIIVIDLNKVQEINDIYGYEEGDKQIQAAANALIKTQLDNSEIMRTDGNEFVIYIVGYSEKQITNYMHKLNKELNKLPYEFGAEFGRSMITDNIKTIEDAMNEAVEDMKKQKVETNEK